VVERTDHIGVLTDPFEAGLQNIRPDIGFSTAVSGGGEAAVYPEPSPMLNRGIDGGSWEIKDGKRSYRLADGNLLKNTWALLKCPDGASKEYAWYYFDEAGRMQKGWIAIQGTSWYHTRDSEDADAGVLETGWYYEAQDERLYLLNPADGKMCSGKLRLKLGNKAEHEYFFARLEDTYRQNWFFDTFLGRWLYDRLGFRSYGSMYINEATPDGGRTDEAGRYYAQNTAHHR